MFKIQLPFNKLSRPVLVFFSFFLILVALYTFWLLNRLPSTETVFWQAVDNNLNSQSVVLETKISVALPEQGDLDLLENQLSLSFAHEVANHLQQKVLFYDQAAAEHYVDPLQIESYQEVGLEDLPEREWYEQNSYGFGNLVYAQHDLYTQPVREDWRNHFNASFTTLPPGAQWYVKNIQTPAAIDFQHFLMSATANNGFLYGKLEAESRHQVMSALRDAYRVDFTDTNTFRRDGRLLYEYKVDLDPSQFGNAFIKYFNANIADPNQRIEISDADLQGVFFGQDIIYTVLVDVWSRQIVRIDYPLEAGAIFDFPIVQGEFVVFPYFSPMIRDLYANTDLDIEVATRVLSRNQYLNLEAPTGVVKLADQEDESGQSQ